MSQERSLEELHTTIAGLRHYEGSKIKHIKSNGYYVITGIHFKEDDMTIWFSYETLHRYTVSFLRPIAELFDGRFQL